MIRKTHLALPMATVLLLGGAGGTIAAAKAPRQQAKGRPFSCKLQLTNQIDGDGSPVLVSAERGGQYGSVRCGKRLGQGVHQDTFTTDDGGNVVGNFHQYFSAGSIHGKFVLTPGDGTSPGPDTFGAVTYSGTFTVTGGTGTLRGVVGKGTLTCSSPDSLHLNCTESGRLRH